MAVYFCTYTLGSLSLTIEVRNLYKNNEQISILDLYNITSLYKSIDTFFSQLINEVLSNNNKYMKVNEFATILDKKICNFYEYIDILRNRTNATRKTNDIIKDAISKYTYTWSAYAKDRAQNKISKTFVKYYDSNYYGLAEWSDEIHKQYFMDAIDEYTANSPNEKKAKDILKLFKELDIEDKEDYVDIIEDKIKKAFS
ncbi:hypothetical protein J2Z42_001997 [Clostridium algifaecis]|uniref:Uncharacterized protein n=1 Tax=Clostridium algifaecis TaxID=1472040 RepID=A0ABS4KWL0_9CLOT|nr:hypothetical protein [Clostridium algifaecis]MBP2033294.1 hypothetical protein [Clostridium algifaecis]